MTILNINDLQSKGTKYSYGVQNIFKLLNATMAKLHELHLELLPYPPYSPGLVASHYWLFADLKRIPQGKRFGSIEEVISETEAYFEAKDKSLY